MASDPEVGAGVENVDCSGRTVLVTGGTGGIGREAALALGRLGATVVVHGRNERRGRAVVDDIEDAGGSAALETADYASLSAVRDLAERVRTEYGDLDVLVNNAGGFFEDGDVTDDGFERTIQVNHLAPFLLTAELADALAPDARVVTTASESYRGGTIDFEAFRSVEEYDGMRAYARSKLANVLFTRELSRRLDGDRTANCLHPGVIPGTGIWERLPARFRIPVKLIDAVPGLPWTATATDGAETVLYLAVSPEVAEVTGGYFTDCERATPTDRGTDDEVADRLWHRSAEMVDVDPQAVGRKHPVAED